MKEGKKKRERMDYISQIALQLGSIKKEQLSLGGDFQKSPSKGTDLWTCTTFIVLQLSLAQNMHSMADDLQPS